MKVKCDSKNDADSIIFLYCRAHSELHLEPTLIAQYFASEATRHVRNLHVVHLSRKEGNSYLDLHFPRKLRLEQKNEMHDESNGIEEESLDIY